MDINENDSPKDNETSNLAFDFVGLEDIKASPVRLKRMATVFKLRTIDNMKWPDIAKEVGVSIPTCFADYNLVCEKFWQKNVDDLKQALSKELAKLDTLEEAYKDSALEGNHESAQILLNVSKQRNRLLNLDKKYVSDSDGKNEIIVTYLSGEAWKNPSSTFKLSSGLSTVENDVF